MVPQALTLNRAPLIPSPLACATPNSHSPQVTSDHPYDIHRLHVYPLCRLPLLSTGRVPTSNGLCVSHVGPLWVTLAGPPSPTTSHS